MSSFVASYSGESIQLEPGTRALPNGDQIVSTRIDSLGGGSHVLEHF